MTFFAPPLSGVSLRPMSAPVDRLPIETWQNIPLFAIEPDVGPSVFATTCSASTFIHFISTNRDSYIEYTRRRTTLRQVCCAWNQILLSTWTYIPTPNRSLRTLVPPSIADQVHAVKRLSMTITDPDREYVESMGVGPPPKSGSTPDYVRCRLPLMYCRHQILPQTPQKFMIFSPESVPKWLSAASGSNFQFYVSAVASPSFTSMPTSRISSLYPFAIWPCATQRSSHFPILNSFT